MSRKAIVAVAALFVGIAAIVVFVFVFQGEDEAPPAEKMTDKSTERADADIPSEIIEKRGPRPPMERIREGKQIEDRASAERSLEESLLRIEKEISSATNPEDRATLVRKKQIIEKMKGRLGD